MIELPLVEILANLLVIITIVLLSKCTQGPTLNLRWDTEVLGMSHEAVGSLA